MVDDYLRTFEGMFFDVEKHEPVKLAIDQVGAVLSSIITRYGEIENEISCGTSRQDDLLIQLFAYLLEKLWSSWMQSMYFIPSVCLLKLRSY